MKRVILFCRDKCSACASLKRFLDGRGHLHAGEWCFSELLSGAVCGQATA
jgi:hypothetical protein